MTKSRNFNKGKPKSTLILKDLAYAFQQVLSARQNGVEKYGRDDFIKSRGTEHADDWLEDNLDSIYRHLDSYGAGNRDDDQSGLHHMAHVAVRAMFAIMYDSVGDITIKSDSSIIEHDES